MAAAAPLFLPPPEAIDVDGISNSTSTTPDKSAGSSGDEFLDLMRSAMPPGGIGGAPFAHTNSQGDLMGLTENMSATFISSGDACLDFFFQVVPSTKQTNLVQYLERAWKQDALTALKLVFQLRGVRGTGKAVKEAFYWAALWLHTHHPATLVENMPMVAEFGYFKDLLEVVLRLVDGHEETDRKAAAKRLHADAIAYGKLRRAGVRGTGVDDRSGDEMANDDDEVVRENVPTRRVGGMRGYYARKGRRAREAAEAGNLQPREDRVAASVAEDRAVSEAAAVIRKQKKLKMASRVTKLYASDLKFRTLYSKVSDVFAVRLKGDVQSLHEGRPLDISLAGKWAPSLDSSYDLRTLLCYAIATRMFPKEAHPEYEGMDNRQYGFAVRDKFRKEVLVPLRRALELPEVYMSAQKWGEVNYRRVPSVAMSNYKDLFLKHDEERFNAFLEAVKSGEVRIAASALLPHEILLAAVRGVDQSAEVAELQWQRMVDDLKAGGTLKNCIAVCDVSGSMMGIPMDVCIALGMLLSDLSEEPWKGHVITFSEIPEMHLLQGESIREKYRFSQTMHCGMNTDLQKVFDKLLAAAQLNKLEKEKMIKRVFIFSDMEFDEASMTPWETDYAAICRKFKLAGYGNPPQTVFWNLRDSGSVPVLGSQEGVALVSGFSKNLLKVFLEDDGALNPINTMRKALEREEYSRLKVVD